MHTIAHDDHVYRLLVDSVLDYAIFLMDPQGYVLSWNSGAERIKGYKAEEIVGRHFTTFYTAEDLALGKPAHELKVAAEVGRFEDEGWRLRKNGTRFWANVIVTALRSPNGDLMGFSKLSRDLTERRSAEEALRRSEEQLRLLVESVKDYGFFMLDTTGVIVSWNPGAERIKGYRPEEIIGQHFSVFYTEKDLLDQKPKRELEIASKVGRFEEESWRVRKDGTLFWANVVINRIIDASGQLRGFVKVTRDVTDRKLQEETRARNAELEEQNRRIQEANRLKSEFLANMSHELRTPLNGVIGFAEFLIDEKPGPLNARQRDYLGDILKSGRHLLNLINEILDLAKIEAGKAELTPETFSVGKVVSEVCSVLAPLAEKKNVIITRTVAEEVDAVTLDQQKFKQVLFNLLSNAVKFTNEHGRVHVAVAPRGLAQFELWVKDNGIGIKASDFSRLFVEFQQLDGGQARRFGGTGLGLALTKKLVELQKGSISVESEFGRGSLFTAVLPMDMTKAGS